MFRAMLSLIFILSIHTLSIQAAPPLYVFDNGTGRGELPLEAQAELAKRSGYAGIFYSGTKDISALLAAHKSRGLKMPGIYTGINISDAIPGFDPGLPKAIEQLRGTGALITFTINGKSPQGDDIALPLLLEVTDLAAKAGLKVALYPHYGFHIARIEDALRLIQKANRPNLGLVFNLCHFLRSGDEANLQTRLREALPHTLMVSINGADHEGDWDRLIQTLDRGAFDVKGFLADLKSMGYKGPIALQCYNVKGDREQNLIASMKAWQSF
jgi:sugar phosphate isomerase/epimerase